MKIVITTIFLLAISICSCINLQGQDRKKLDSLWNAFKQAKHDTTRIKILNEEIGFLYENYSPDSAVMYYIQAISIADNTLGTSTTTRRTELAEVTNPNTANSKLLSLKANSLRYIGIVHSDQGSYDKAIEYYLKSLKIQEELQDKKGMSDCYHNIGNVHYYHGSYDKAIEYYLKALKIQEELQDKKGMSDCYINIGNVHSDQGSYDKAIEYFLKSLKITEELQDKKGMSACYTNIGNVHNYQGSYDKAIEYYLKSLKIDEELQDKNGMAIVYGNISSLHITLADSSAQLGGGGRAMHLKAALEYGNKAYDLALDIGSVPTQNNAADHLQKAYTKLGMYKEAIKYAEIYISTQDSMFSEDKTKALAEMGAKYEAEKKQLEIEKMQKQKELDNKTIEAQTAENRKQQIIIFSAVGGLLIVLIFSIIILRMFRQKRKANILLATQNTEIRQQKEEISAQRDEITAQRDTVVKQKDRIEEQNKNITDSITYAKRIQQAVLPSGNYANSILGEHFILFKPKDIVSGDFYWGTRVNEWLIVTVADCTGHGVPGAFMSMLGVSFLNEIVRKKEVTKASDVLNNLRDSIIEALQQKGSDQEQKDGMDIALFALNTNDNTLQFAGANNPIYIVTGYSSLVAGDLQPETSNQKPVIRNQRLIEIEPDNQPVAIYVKMKSFTNNVIQLNKGDCIYLASDGYEDQFGGPKNKKFMAKQLKELFVNIAEKPMNEQQEILNTTFENWRGEHEQIDDVTVMGIRI